MQQLSLESRAKLRRKIANHFGIEDLRVLSFDLGIDFESLSGETKETKIVNLILLLERAGELDKLIEECVLRRPNLEWNDILETCRITSNAETRKHRNKALFLAGCATGNRIAILPLPSEKPIDVRGLDEFIDTLHQIGVRDRAVIAPIIEAREQFTSPDSTRLENDAVKNIVERFFEAIAKVPGQVQSKSTTEEFPWFKFGQLLFEVATSRVLEQSALSSVIALESQIERMNLPSSLQQEVDKFIQLARTSKSRSRVYETANRIAQATYSLF